MHAVRTRRVYEQPEPEDGARVLVDRVWPRGVTKDAAALDLWLKDAAPSTELRRWFGHDPARWDEFRRRYAKELDAKPEALEPLRSLTRKRPVTLLFGAKDEAHNNAVALAEYVQHRKVREPPSSSR